MTATSLARPAASLPLMAACWLFPAWQVQAQTKVVVDPAGRTLGTAYVVEAIDADVEPGAYALVPEGGEEPGEALVFAQGGATYLGAVVPGLDGSKRTYTLQAGATADRPAVHVEKEDGGEFAIAIGGEPFTRLVQGERKPYFHPVIGPTGAPVTRAYPMAEVEGEDRDHPHQRSFWFTHGDVNGFEFWGSDPLNKDSEKTGHIRQTSAEVLAEGGAVGVLRTTNEWVGGGKVLCADERIIRVFGSGSPRVIDVDVTVKATNGPVTFGDTKEGMFGLRVASAMNANRDPGGRIVNAEGLTDTEAWGKPSPWVDYTGPVGGATLGVAILNHPTSFRYPTTWHVRDYGLFAANPFGYGDFDFKSMDEEGAYTLPAGESMTFRYRVILHEGTTDEADIARAFVGYADEPEIAVVAD